MEQFGEGQIATQKESYSPLNPNFAIGRITTEQLYSFQGLAAASDRNARMATVVSNDLELLQAIAVGDSAAFSQYFDKYAPRVLGFLVKLLPNRSDADDVLQEVFWQVWKTAQRYDSTRATPLVWLFLMARSRAIDLMRKRKTEILTEREERTLESTPSSDNMEFSESCVQVNTALSQLPDEQSSAIRLAFFNGLAHPEIAQQLNIPLGTAKTRIRSGMKRLRAIVIESRQTVGANR